MAAGDKPFMVSGGKVTWEKESTFGTSPASGAWNTFGYRMGDLRDLGPDNTWNQQRAWASGREAAKLDRLAKDYGGPLAEFKMTDLRVPGFAWGEEVNAPTQIGATAYYTHKVTPTTNHPAASMAVQIHDEDADGNATRTTYTGSLMSEVEIAGNEGGEVTYTPTFICQGEDTSIAENTVTEPSSTSYKHHHGYIEVYDQQLLRVVSWRARIMNQVTRARYYNDSNPLLAYELPFEDFTTQFTARAVADGKQFSGFGSRDLRRLAENGDIGKAVIRWRKTENQDEARIVIGDSSDALALASAPRVRPAGGGRVMYELDFVCRTSYYEYVDTTSTRYFPS